MKWHAVRASARGRAHIRLGIPCQDKTAYMERNGIQVIALADGAGSACFSHFGAQCVVDITCRTLVENFDVFISSATDAQQVRTQLIECLLMALDTEAVTQGCVASDLASTLLFAAIKDDQFLLAHIGDGVIGYVKNGQIKVASAPENGEFANTTTFVTSPEACDAIRLIKGTLGDIEGFILMSDGAQTSFYDHKQKCLAPVLVRIMSLCEVVGPQKVQLRLQESLENVIAGRTTDDCSVAFLSRDTGRFRGYRSLTWLEKAQLLELGPNWNRTMIRRYDRVLESLAAGASAQRALKNAYISGERGRNYFERLLRLGLIAPYGGRYTVAVPLG